MTDFSEVSFAPLGDSAVLVALGNSMDREVNRAVHALVAAIAEANVPGVVDIVPAYASLAVHYDPGIIDAREMEAALRRVMVGIPDHGRTDRPGKLVSIPVRYDGADLLLVAEATGLPVEEVIARHSAPEYLVYMIGFTPGFAYLGELDPALQLPRRASPRTRVPRGAVAIAEAQTAVYPHETPGGWHLIGTTDLRMFDASREPPSLLSTGDRVRFERIA